MAATVTAAGTVTVTVNVIVTINFTVAVTDTVNVTVAAFDGVTPGITEKTETSTTHGRATTAAKLIEGSGP